MKLIVLIGGIASGKSTVSRAFVERGSAHIDLDVVGHSVLLKESVKEQLSQRFGADIFDEEGEIIRPVLAKKAFASAEDTLALNGITQPAIIADAWDRIHEFEKNGVEACIVEISPYDGPEGIFGVFTDKADATIAVVAPLELRIARAVAKGFNVDDVRNRIARQVTDEQRRRWADFTVVNDGTNVQLDHEVTGLWNKIMGLK